MSLYTDLSDGSWADVGIFHSIFYLEGSLQTKSVSLSFSFLISDAIAPYYIHLQASQFQGLMRPSSQTPKLPS